MAATAQEVRAAERPIVNFNYMIGGLLLYTVFYIWIRWYEGVYGWSAGLDAFSPEFEKYWMNFLYTEIVLEVVTASLLWGYLWRSRPMDLDTVDRREELRRAFNSLIWWMMYAWAIYWGASYFTEQDGTWHQTVIRDTDFTPSHIIEFYLSYPIYIISGFAAWIYTQTRLPYFDLNKRGFSLPLMITVVGPFMILPNVGLNEWGHTFWWMEELFVAPLHYGFVFFGWFALSVLGILQQASACFLGILGRDLTGDELYEAGVAKYGDAADWRFVEGE